MMESLSPLERAVFVLREVFGWPHAEIADILDRSEPAVRQLDHRARAHLREGSDRFVADDDAVRQGREVCADLGSFMAGPRSFGSSSAVGWRRGGAAREPVTVAGDGAGASVALSPRRATNVTTVVQKPQSPSKRSAPSTARAEL